MTSAYEHGSTECSVCKEPFKEPKLLTCAHLLCRPCLAQLLEGRSPSLCPICSTAIVSARGADFPACNPTADAFPTDLATAALVDIWNILSKPRVCCVCDEGPAAFFCLQCRIMMCQSCVKKHDKLVRSCLHQISDIENLTLGMLITSQPVPCAEHAEEPSVAYCEKHDVPICGTCAAIAHRNCSDVASLGEMTERSQEALCEMESQLCASQAALQVTVTDLREAMQQSERKTTAALTEIDAAFDRLMVSVETRRERLKSYVRGEDTKVTGAASGALAVLQQKLERLVSHSRLIERMQSMSPCAHVGVMSARLKARIQELEASAPFLSYPHSATPTNFSVDHEALNRVHQELARVKVKSMWKFHSHSGRNIRLDPKNLTARRMRDWNNGIVMSADPMAVNKLYEVVVKEVDVDRKGMLMNVGVVLKAPSRVRIPPYADFLEPAISIWGGGVCVEGKWIHNNYGHNLRNVTIGSRVGVLIDSKNCLHLYVDGKDQGVAAHHILQPCYALFDLFGFHKKVSVLPLTPFLHPGHRWNQT